MLLGCEVDIDTVQSTQGYQDEPLEADLADFEVYRCPSTACDKAFAYELTSLHRLGNKNLNLRVDGLISCGTSSYFVQALAIERLRTYRSDSEESNTVTVRILCTLRSKDESHRVWLRLQEPCHAYERFHGPFMWIASLARHVIDYLGQSKGSIGLHNFRGDFGWGLIEQRGQRDEFDRWFSQVNHRIDLRTAINAYKDFIWKQTIGTRNEKHLQSHSLWAECMQGGCVAVKAQQQSVQGTVATPQVFNAFQGMYFEKYLKKIPLSKAVKEKQNARKVSMGFAQGTPSQATLGGADNTTGRPIREGDVVSFVHKRFRSGGSPLFFGLVQAINSRESSEEKLLHILRIIRPNDTIIGAAPYPIANELFLTDQCNCNGEDWEIYASDVQAIHCVDWSPSTLETSRDIIIRQTYLTQNKAFVTVQEDHKTCLCHRKEIPPAIYHQGDTVYVTDGNAARLQPVVIRERDEISGTWKAQVLKPLEDYEELALQSGRKRTFRNELVFTLETTDVHPSQIVRACDIRFMSQSRVINNKIPFPYNRWGTGDHWFVSMVLLKNPHHLRWMQNTSWPMKEAPWVPSIQRKLRGLSVFGGGGGLDRGLEEGGAVEFKHVVDIDPTAIHTQRANSQDPTQVCYYCGSVNDYLKHALSRAAEEPVAKIGEVDLIAAGCPCQGTIKRCLCDNPLTNEGFSMLQRDKASDQSLNNASLVTTFCSFVDVYRPSFGILENVRAIAFDRDDAKRQRTEGTTDEEEHNVGPTKSKNVLPRLIACLVSMGYQVNHYIMNSEKYGSCQRRWRMIVTIAAPGLTPILEPASTHGALGVCQAEHHTDGQCSERGECVFPTFKQLDAQAGIGELPSIPAGADQACIPFPDHRLPNWIKGKTRRDLARIPRTDVTQPHDRSQRLCPDRLMPTVRTKNQVQSKGYAASIHWNQDRPITIQETRRAQGWPDDETIIGSPSQQFAIVGNGVDRAVSYPLGMSLFSSVVNDTIIQQERMSVQVRESLSIRPSATLPEADKLMPTPPLTPCHSPEDTNDNGSAATTISTRRTKRTATNDMVIQSIANRRSQSTRQQSAANCPPQMSPRRTRNGLHDATAASARAIPSQARSVQTQSRTRILYTQRANSMLSSMRRKRRRISMKEVQSLGVSTESSCGDRNSRLRGYEQPTAIQSGPAQSPGEVGLDDLSAVMSLSSPRAASPPWRSFGANGPTTVFKNGVRKSLRVSHGGAYATASKITLVQHNKVRATSPPWKVFSADGPATVFENGIRKSTRVNRAISVGSPETTPSQEVLELSTTGSTARSMLRNSSPPWKSFSVDGSTAIVENGIRKSSRANQEPTPLAAESIRRAASPPWRPFGADGLTSIFENDTRRSTRLRRKKPLMIKASIPKPSGSWQSNVTANAPQTFSGKRSTNFSHSTPIESTPEARHQVAQYALTDHSAIVQGIRSQLSPATSSTETQADLQRSSKRKMRSTQKMQAAVAANMVHNPLRAFTVRKTGPSMPADKAQDSSQQHPITQSLPSTSSRPAVQRLAKTVTLQRVIKRKRTRTQKVLDEAAANMLRNHVATLVVRSA